MKKRKSIGQIADELEEEVTAIQRIIEEIQNSFPEKTFDDPTIGYAITYPLGVFGIIGTIVLSKILLKINPERYGFNLKV